MISAYVYVLVQIETGVFEFRDPKLERTVGLTPADRKWMDDIVKDVNDGWNDDDPTRPTGMQCVLSHFDSHYDVSRTTSDSEAVMIICAQRSIRVPVFVDRSRANR